MNRLLSLLLACLVVPAVGPQPRPDFDLLIRGGMLVDGSGGKPVRADVAVRDGRITRVGRMEKASAAQVIDATGLFVAPGFIGVHACGRCGEGRAPRTSRVSATAIVAGNCGLGPRHRSRRGYQAVRDLQ
jgi:N-acyl-D-amino-acid deacylase